MPTISFSIGSHPKIEAPYDGDVRKNAKAVVKRKVVEIREGGQVIARLSINAQRRDSTTTNKAQARQSKTSKRPKSSL